MRTQSISRCRALATFGSLAYLALTVGSAAAEPRYGTTFGAGLGIGHLSCEDSNGNDCSGGGSLPAAGLDVRIGSLVGPGVEVAGELWGMRHSESGSTVSQAILSAVVRGWVAPRLWLQGGIGVARTSSQYDTTLGAATDQSDVVPALTGGVGFELLSQRDFAIDLELKGGAGLYQDNFRVYNASLGAGVSFY